MNRTQPLLSAAEPWFIGFTLGLGLFANMLPWNKTLGAVSTDYVLLLLLYWALHEPERISMGCGWGMGLLMDIVHANLLGQHALAYTMVLYCATSLQRRVKRFGPWRQAAHILPLLIAACLLMVVTRLWLEDRLPTWTYGVSPFMGALVWAPLSYLLQWPQRRSNEPDGTL